MLLWQVFLFICLYCIINQFMFYLTMLTKAKRRHSFFKTNTIYLRNFPHLTRQYCIRSITLEQGTK